MFKKISIFLTTFLMSASFALAADDSGQKKLDGVINWIGQGARVVGIIALVFGFWQLGLSFANDEPGERNKALLFLGCGLILFWAPDILLLFMRWNIIDPTKW